MLHNLKYSVPKEPTGFYNGSNYDYDFIMKELTEEIEKQVTCLGETTEQYITFTVPIERELIQTDKNGGETTKIYFTYYNLFIAQDLW